LKQMDTLFHCKTTQQSLSLKPDPTPEEHDRRRTELEEKCTTTYHLSNQPSLSDPYGV
jgi:hypothetical protein